jgi:hypothetical protein
VNSISFNSGTPTVYVLELHAGIQPGDTVTLSYTPGTIHSADSGILESVSGRVLTNNLSDAAPTISMATTQDDNNNVNNDGTYISVVFSLPMDDPPDAPDVFRRL